MAPRPQSSPNHHQQYPPQYPFHCWHLVSIHRVNSPLDERKPYPHRTRIDDRICLPRVLFKEETRERVSKLCHDSNKRHPLIYRSIEEPWRAPGRQEIAIWNSKLHALTRSRGSPPRSTAWQEGWFTTWPATYESSSFPPSCFAIEKSRCRGSKNSSASRWGTGWRSLVSGFIWKRDSIGNWKFVIY